MAGSELGEQVGPDSVAAGRTFFGCGLRVDLGLSGGDGDLFPTCSVLVPIPSGFDCG
jgi:hypothetical protein